MRLSRSDLIGASLIAAALLLVYLPGLDNQPVFDDDYLVDGTLVAEYRSWAELRTRMLSYGSFVWLQDLFGEGWWKQRLATLALHFATVGALWALYREMLRHVAPPPPAEGRAAPFESSPALPVAIAFFALNPAAVYAVAYLIQRSIVMATLFTVLALWLFARGLARRSAVCFALAALCYALAVFSKEHAILAPLAAVPLYILVARPAPRRLTLVAGGGALLAGAAAFLLWLRHGEILGTPFDEFSRVYLAQLAALNPDAQANAFGLSIVNEAWLFFEYGVRWLVPYSGWMSINLRPPFPLTWWSFPHVLGIAGYAAVVAGGFALLLRYRDWRALIGVSVLIPALLFVTEFATVWVQDPFVLYRSYLWAIGIPGLVFCLVHGPAPRVVLAVGLALGGLLVWQALDRVLSLDTPEHAWTDAIAKLPADPRAVGRWFPYLNRGSAYVDRDQFALASADFETSSALGDMGMGAFNLGAVQAAEGKHAQALAQFDRAEKQGYDLFNLSFQRGLSLLATGQPQEAYRQFALAKAKQPPSPTRELVYLHMGRTAFQLGRIDDAVSAFEQLLQVDPRHKEGRYLLGLAYVRRGQFEEGRVVLTPLLATGSGDGPAYYARAIAHHGLGRKAEALADIEQALRLDPANAHLRDWEARIRAMPAPR